MVPLIKEKAVIQPGGIIQIQRSDLPEGATVEVTVVIEEPATEPSAPQPLTSFWGVAKGTYGSTPKQADQFLDQQRASN